jgi:hypothetical protein
MLFVPISGFRLILDRMAEPAPQRVSKLRAPGRPIAELILKAALILFLSAGPSAACDPEEMINELRAQCRDAIASAVALMEPIKQALSTMDRDAVEAKVKEATGLCNTDKYTEGYMVTAKLSRFIGHLEARKGIAPVL